MNTDPILTKGARLAKRGKYAQAIQILEPEVVRYHDSFRYYYILACACLYSQDYGGAFTYFKRARDIKMREPSVLLGMALLFLRRGETDRAVDLYLEVQEIDPKNKQAREALKVIRKHGEIEYLETLLKSGRLKKLYPPLVRVPFSFQKLILPASVFLAVLGGAFFFFILPKENAKKEQRSGFSVSALEKEEENTPVETGGVYRYILTQREVLDGYERARRLFTGYRDEAAKVELNRLLESNASEAVKNKARLLVSYTAAPGFDTIKDRFSYAEASADPILYKDCYVIWRGMATNIIEKENRTEFQLLVGYDTRNTLEGIVSVSFDRAVLLDTEHPLEVLGRVVPLGSGKASLRMEGAAIHQEPALKP